MATLKVKIVPGSSRDGIAGWRDDVLRIKVMAPPEKGKANKAVTTLLADRLGLDRKAVRITSGHTSASKILSIDGLTSSQVKTALDI